MPKLIYSKTKDDIYINLYVSITAEINLDDKIVNISQETSYPWNGNVKIKGDPVVDSKFSLKLRVPGWSRNEVLSGNLYNYLEDANVTPQIRLNGENIEINIEGGYISMNREWKSGGEIEISFPMQVREVKADERVVDNRSKFALEYGPLVYAFEEVDNKSNFQDLSVAANSDFNIEKEHDLLQGVNTVNFHGFKGCLIMHGLIVGIGEMKVWLPFKVRSKL